MRIDTARLWLQAELSPDQEKQEPQHALQLLSWACDKPSAELIAHPEKELTQEQFQLLTKALYAHRTQHKPIQYILGSVPFMSATITVQPPILIPRPETEYWCEFITGELKKLNKKKMTILDMCTGSGCVAIALAQEFKEATIYAVDDNKEAVALAQENALKNGCTNVIPVHSDLFAELSGQMFDVIVSNPPYVTQKEWNSLDPSITLWEDPHALIASDDGLSLINKIIRQAPSFLTKRTESVPQLLIECSEYHLDAVITSMEKSGYTAQRHTDGVGKPRFVTGKLV